MHGLKCWFPVCLLGHSFLKQYRGNWFFLITLYHLDQNQNQKLGSKCMWHPYCCSTTKKFPRNPIFFLKRRYSLYTYSMIVTVHGYFSGLRQIIYLMLYFSFFCQLFQSLKPHLVILSLYQSTISLSVSEWVCLDVP